MEAGQSLAARPAGLQRAGLEQPSWHHRGDGAASAAPDDAAAMNRRVRPVDGMAADDELTQGIDSRQVRDAVGMQLVAKRHGAGGGALAAAGARAVPAPGWL